MDDLSRTRHEFQKADAELSQSPSSMLEISVHIISGLGIFSASIGV